MAERKILVLGAGGRVGRLLRQVWPKDRQLTEALFQARSAGDGIDLVCDPGHDARAVTRLAALSPDLVFGLWGVTPRSAAGDPQDNTRLARLAVEIARRSGARQVVLASTAAVYAGAGGAFSEDDPRPALSAYGLAKQAMERAVLAEAHRDRGPGVSVLRLANIVGADMLADAVSRGAPLRLDRFADGRGPRRSYLSPLTLARALDAIARHRPRAPQLLNLADGSTPWDMAELLAAMGAAGRDIAWTWREAGETAIALHSLDVTRFATRYPQVAGGFRRSAAQLVADGGLV